VTQTGTDAMMRGAGRPASAAAASSAGLICSRIAAGPLSHRIVPAVRDPASWSIRGPIAASITVGAATAVPPMPSDTADQMSPVKDTLRSSSTGSSTERYSSMCFAGVAKGILRVPSTLVLWASPMPRISRPRPIASTTVDACAASISGCRGHVGITAVPSSIVLVSSPIVAMAVSASGTPSWASQ
jgi:hypothetical protein